MQIVLQNMAPSDALEARIREGAAKLEQLHPRIMSCRVAVDEVDKHRTRGRQYRVKVEVRAPGGEEAVSTQQSHEDVYVAVRDAFDAVRRQLEEAAGKARDFGS